MFSIIWTYTHNQPLTNRLGMINRPKSHFTLKTALTEYLPISIHLLSTFNYRYTYINLKWQNSHKQTGGAIRQGKMWLLLLCLNKVVYNFDSLMSAPSPILIEEDSEELELARQSCQPPAPGADWYKQRYPVFRCIGRCCWAGLPRQSFVVFSRVTCRAVQRGAGLAVGGLAVREWEDVHRGDYQSCCRATWVRPPCRTTTHM